MYVLREVGVGGGGWGMGGGGGGGEGGGYVGYSILYSDFLF